MIVQVSQLKSSWKIMTVLSIHVFSKLRTPKNIQFNLFNNLIKKKHTSSQSFWNVENSVASLPVAPLLITYTKSCVRTKGTRSRQNPNFSLK